MPGMFGNLIGPGAAKRPVGGIPDFLEEGAAPLVQMPQQAPQPRQGGGGRHILGIIADTLAGAAGQPGMYAQNNYARQREARRRAEIEAQYERQRRDGWDDFVRKAQYERENPRPTNNDTVADFNFIASQLGPDEANQYLRNRADPIVNIPLPGGDVYMGPRSGMGALKGSAAPAPAATTKPPESILQGGASTGLISPEEADVVRQSLGPNGQAAFDGWARQNGVRVGKRLSNGQTAYFINGKWYDNPEGR